MKKIAGILILLIIISLSYSCRKDDITTDSSAKLAFSNDSVIFDTVFTTIGSTTKRLMVYNRNSDKVVISSISLDNGANSQYRINVDGVSGNIHQDVEIEGNDSMFIFLEVTVDPNNALTPFIVEEKLNFITNGNSQSVLLVAWGQNAHYYIANRTAFGVPIVYLDRDNSDDPLDETWINDKPYIIYGGYLTLDADDRLKIDPGVRIHMSNSAGFWVFQNGNIQVNGTVTEPVTFQGIRLDFAYQDVSGQWDRIWINEGNSDNVFNHAIIKNAFIGIQAETLPFDPNLPTSSNKLRLNSCEIHNSSAIGILATNYQITDTNSFISNSGQYNVLVRGGGEYQFNHTTIANYWNESSRTTPSIFLQNYYVDIDGNTQVRDIDSTNFYNCIIDGNIDNEFDTDVFSPGTINFKFDHSILKTDLSTAGTNYINVITNTSAAIFTNENLGDFTLIGGSPAIDNGRDIGVLQDHAGITRTLPTDIGAFEFQ